MKLKRKLIAKLVYLEALWHEYRTIRAQWKRFKLEQNL